MHLNVVIRHCVRLSHFTPIVLLASVWRDVHIRHPERDLKAQRMLYSPYLTSPCYPALHSTCASAYRVSVCRMHGQALDRQRAQCFRDAACGCLARKSQNPVNAQSTPLRSRGASARSRILINPQQASNSAARLHRPALAVLHGTCGVCGLPKDNAWHREPVRLRAGPLQPGSTTGEERLHSRFCSPEDPVQLNPCSD